MNAELVSEVRRALAENANPEKSDGMRAYMKSEMPYRGVQKPVRVKLLRPIFREHAIVEKSEWEATILELWRNASYREERYAALDLAEARQYTSFRTFDTIPMFEEIVVTGGWWDYVEKNWELLSPLSRREALKNAPKIRGIQRTAGA